MKSAAVLLITAVVARDHHRRAKYEQLLNQVNESMSDAQIYFNTEVRPVVEDFEASTTDLWTTVEAQLNAQADADKNGQTVKPLDWDLIGDKIKAVDVKHTIDWDLVEERAEKINTHINRRVEKINKRIDHANEKINMRIDHANEKINKRIDHANEKVNKRINHANERAQALNDRIDWDGITASKEQVKAVDWTGISEHITIAANSVGSIEWKNFAREDYSIDWDVVDA